jgi:hypothetical protein
MQYKLRVSPLLLPHGEAGSLRSRMRKKKIERGEEKD